MTTSRRMLVGARRCQRSLVEEEGTKVGGGYAASTAVLGRDFGMGRRRVNDYATLSQPRVLRVLEAVVPAPEPEPWLDADICRNIHPAMRSARR